MRKTLILCALVAIVSSCSVMFSPDPDRPVPTYQSPDPFILHRRRADNRKEARDQFNRWNKQRPYPAKSYNLSGVNYRDNGIQSDFRYRDPNGKSGKITIISQPMIQPGHQPDGRPGNQQNSYPGYYQNNYQGYQPAPGPQPSHGQSTPAPTDKKQNYSRSAGPEAQTGSQQPPQNSGKQQNGGNQQPPQNNGGTPQVNPAQTRSAASGSSGSSSSTTSSSKTANPGGGRRN